MYEFRLADVGEGIHEVQLLEWHVRPGDEVSEYQPLCQVESAKATVELTSPVAGRVHETRVPQGGTAQVGDVLVVLDTALGIVGSAPSPRVRAAPLVRKLARDQGIPLDDVAGSGPQGRIRLADLEQHVQHRQAAEPAGERLELRGVRRRMAEHMAEATRIPAVTAIDTFDVTDLVWTRDELLGHAEAEGVHLTYLPFVVKAAVEALRAVPEANSVFDEHGPAILYKREYHIGIAVAAPAGLLVPVVRNADRLSLMELAVELARLAEAARQEKLSPADLSGSTFTITSFGGLSGGVQFATPIVNSPEVAILGVGRIEQQPRVIDGQVVPRHCVGVSFTFDHRVLDGEGAGRFLATLRRYLERPSELLLRLR